MATGLVFDERFLLHRAPYDHPEHPGRLTAIQAGLEREGLVKLCRRVPARPATDSELTAVHTAEHVRAIDATAGRDFAQLDPDTYTSRDSATSSRSGAKGLRTVLRSSGRPATTPRPITPWASVSSTTWRSPQGRRGPTVS